MQRCPRCKQTKENCEFYKNRAKPSGFHTICKLCTKIYRDSDKNKLYITLYRIKRDPGLPERIRIRKEKRLLLLERKNEKKRLSLEKKENKRKAAEQSAETKKVLALEPIILKCTECGIEGTEHFSKMRLVKYINSNVTSKDVLLGKRLRYNLCKQCCKKIDDKRFENLTTDYTKVITCPECKASGNFSSGLFSELRYLKAKKRLLCKLCRREREKLWNGHYYRKIRNNQSKRISEVIKDQLGFKKKHENTMNLIGCSPSELMTHLEQQFDKTMNWDNYSTWHIDHIIPISAFHLRCSYHRKLCFNYNNLQPLWANDNIKKSNTVNFNKIFNKKALR